MNKLLRPISILTPKRNRIRSYNVNGNEKENNKRKVYKSIEVYPILTVYKTEDVNEDEVFELDNNRNGFDLIDDIILEYILSHLTVVDLIRLSGVSKRFNRIIWDPELWKKSLIFNQKVDVDKALDHITTKLWLNVYAYPKWIKITYFSVTNGAKMTDKSINILTRHLPALQCLKIHNCEGLTTEAMYEFTMRCEKLMRVDLTGCSNVKSFHLSAARPVYANFTGCSKFRDYGFFDTTSCNDLVILYLNGCSEITDRGIGWISREATKLRKLVLSDCTGLTDESLEYLVNIKDSLEYLSISNILGITDQGLHVFQHDWPKLQYLDMSGCLGVAHAGFDHIGRGCKKLRSLNIANTNVCDRALKNLAVNLVNLKNINLRNCYYISLKGLYAFVAERKTSLKKINIKGCNIKSEVGFMYSKDYQVEYDDTLFHVKVEGC